MNHSGKMMNKLKCFVGFHEWIYDNPNKNHSRDCRRCRRHEEYTLVNFGMEKIWLPFDKP